MSALGLIYINASASAYNQVSIGVASLHTHVISCGHSSSVFDTRCATDDEIVQQCTESGFDWVGISTTELGLGKAYGIATALRRAGFAGGLIMGGPFATLFPEQVLSESAIDFVCVGDGENVLEFLLGGQDPSEIQGLWFKRSGAVVRGGAALPFDVDTHSVTDYSCFPSETVAANRALGTEAVRLSFSWTSRGCPYACSYCSNAALSRCTGYRTRYRSPGNACAEMAFLVKRYECTAIFLSDEDFLQSRPHASEFARVCSANPTGVRFGFLSRPEHISGNCLEELKCLKRAGWNWVSMGVETGDECARTALLHRRSSNKQIEEAFGICRDLGVQTTAFLVIGFPFERASDYKAAQDLLRRCQPDAVECSFLYPLSGTEVKRELEASGTLQWSAHPENYFDSPSVRHPCFSTQQLVAVREHLIRETAGHLAERGDILDVLREASARPA